MDIGICHNHINNGTRLSRAKILQKKREKKKKNCTGGRWWVLNLLQWKSTKFLRINTHFQPCLNLPLIYSTSIITVLKCLCTAFYKNIIASNICCGFIIAILPLPNSQNLQIKPKQSHWSKWNKCNICTYSACLKYHTVTYNCILDNEVYHLYTDT